MRKFKVILNEKNDFWHYLFRRFDKDNAREQPIADKIVKFMLESAWNYAFITIIFSLSVLCRFQFPSLQAIPSSIFVVWCVAFLMTFNIAMSLKVLTSFVFWYKMYNWASFVMFYVLLFDSATMEWE